MDLTPYIRAIPDFPKPGILFRDITPLLQSPPAFGYVIDEFEEITRAAEVDLIVGIESRGFIFGTPLALRLQVPFAPVRKPGKLPARCASVEYALEYGSGQLEIHQDAIRKGQRVAIVDDLLATGGTAQAAARLVESCGGQVTMALFVIELKALGGASKLVNYPYRTLISY
jgi:adenine phosphoribosyltransferase